ncbi:MAG: GtrA family protein [Roseiarcus sp.]
MSHGGPQTLDARDALARQIPAFLIIGALGFCLDASLTVLLVRSFGVPPLLARPPAFVVVTLVNFVLNRAFTFRHSQTPWLRALGRYVLVCLAGLAVNYAVYAALLALAPLFGVAISPAILTLFVACGTAAATLLTFAGFRSFAFRA